MNKLSRRSLFGVAAGAAIAPAVAKVPIPTSVSEYAALAPRAAFSALTREALRILHQNLDFFWSAPLAPEFFGASDEMDDDDWDYNPDHEDAPQ